MYGSYRSPLTEGGGVVDPRGVFVRRAIASLIALAVLAVVVTALRDLGDQQRGVTSPPPQMVDAGAAPPVQP